MKAREVSREEAEQYAKEEGLLFVEASAKSGLNVEQAFVDSSIDILEKIKNGAFDDNRVCPNFISTFPLSLNLQFSPPESNFPNPSPTSLWKLVGESLVALRDVRYSNHISRFLILVDWALSMHGISLETTLRLS